MKKILSLLLAGTLLFSSFDEIKAEESIVTDYEELKKAIENAPMNEEETVIIVGGEIDLDTDSVKPIQLKKGQNIVLLDNGYSTHIKLSGSGKNCIFDIVEGSKMAIRKSETAYIEISGEDYIDNSRSNRDSGVFLVKGELVMDYADIHNLSTGSFDSGIITVYGGKFTMNGGTIHNNDLTSQMEGVVHVTHGGNFTMNGGDISNNYLKPEALFNAAVTVEPKYGKSRFEMNGGTIDSNTAFAGGVMVGSMHTELFSYDYQNDMAEMVMNGGTISNNSSIHAGGGVSVLGRARFEMYDGLIDSNSARMGGGVGVYDYFKIYFEPYYPSLSVSDYETVYNIPSEFVMYGGKITNNKALKDPADINDETGGCGGGVYAASNSVKLIKGLIESNTAERQGGGVYCAARPYEMLIENALITKNTSDEVGGGIWSCPTGKIDLLELSGNRVYGNVSLEGEDVFLEATVEGLKEYKEKREEMNISVDEYSNVLLIKENSAPKGGGVGTNGKVTINGYTPITPVSVETKVPESHKYKVVNTSTK